MSKLPNTNESRGAANNSDGQEIPQPNADGLINEKMYSIQIGEKLFKLSGASLSSDSPSYFTSFFSDKNNKGEILFIDRSPAVFEKIYLHLQGYYINVEDEYEFVYLFADAHYFNLPALKTILYKSDIFTKIGNKSFRISKELITSEGNFPNYFSVSFNTLFRDPVPMLSKFLRPPLQKPPVLSNHSPELFEELLGILQGKCITIANEQHREDLLKECRYYKFLALEQKIINHKIVLDPFSLEEEIILSLNDMKKKGLEPIRPESEQKEMILRYARPYVDSSYRNLVMQIESSETTLSVNRLTGATTLRFVGGTAKRLNFILGSLTTDFMYDEEKVIFAMIVDLHNAHCIVNDREMVPTWVENLLVRGQPEALIEFKVLKAQYKILFHGAKPWFEAALLEAVSDVISFNKRVGFI